MVYLGLLTIYTLFFMFIYQSGAAKMINIEFLNIGLPVRAPVVYIRSRDDNVAKGTPKTARDFLELI